MNIEKEKPNNYFEGNPDAVAKRQQAIREGRPLEERGVRNTETPTKVERIKTPDDYRRQAQAYKDMTGSAKSIEDLMESFSKNDSDKREVSGDVAKKETLYTEKWTNERLRQKAVNMRNHGDTRTEEQIIASLNNSVNMGHDISKIGETEN